jgi:hypothetical protein
VNYVLVEHLSDTVNAVLNYSVRGTWGYKNNESKWSGMIGELTRNEADIGGTALFLTSDRIEIIDYIAMTTPTRSKFIFRQPKLSYVANVFTLPFDGLVWASTCALLLIMAMVLYVVVKWEWKKKKYVEIAVRVIVTFVKSQIVFTERVERHRNSQFVGRGDVHNGRRVVSARLVFDSFQHPWSNYFNLLAGFFDVFVHILLRQYCCPVAIIIKQHSDPSRHSPFASRRRSGQHSIQSLLLSCK